MATSALPSPTGKGPFAIAADRLFNGARVLLDHAAVIDGESVSAVMPVAALPPGLPLLREPDTTIIPGLIDTHIHLMDWQSPQFLAHGVTAVRDVGNDLDWILERRRRSTLAFDMPRVRTLGPLLDGPKPHHPHVSWPCGDEAAVTGAIARLAAAGVDGIKLYAAFPTGLLPVAVRAAHDVGLKVSKHCLGDGVLVAARAGVDEFFHLDGVLADIWPGHRPGWLEVWGDEGLAGTLDAQRRVADEIARLGAVSTPTLAYWDSQWRIRTPGRTDGEDSPGVPQEMIDWQGTAPRSQPGADHWRRALAAAQGFQRLLLDRGVRTLAGTDVPCGAIPAGLSLWREMELLVESGMSPLQALVAATRDAADFMEEPTLGRLAPSAAADLAVVCGDPTAAIPQCPRVTLVLRAGRLLRPAEQLDKQRATNLAAAGDPWAAQFAWHVQRQRERK